MTKSARQEPKTSREEVAVFYLERLMDQLDRQCFLLAHRTFVRHRTDFLMILDENLVDSLQKRVQSEIPQEPDSPNQVIEKVTHAVQFGEYRTAYDLGTEYLLAHDQPDASNGSMKILETIRNLLADARRHYLEPDEVQVNTLVNAEIGFIVDRRGICAKTGQPLSGNPGFTWIDVMGHRYRCFIKQVPDAEVGDLLRLKITNVTNSFIDTSRGREQVVYLEPRVQKGDLVPIEVLSLSHNKHSYTFRLHSYDGFLWLRHRSVNRKKFNEQSLHPGDRILAEVLYTTDEIKMSPTGNPKRLGLIKALPIKRLDTPATTDPSTAAATTPN
ncbi:MAG: hypothetical protein ABIH23_34940 [bacterium]